MIEATRLADEWDRMPPQIPTTRITEAVGAWCVDCGHPIGCQYWPLAKTVWMHRRGCPDHEVTLWKWGTR